MLRLVLAALYVSLELVPQHRFYLSEFRVAKLAPLIQFLEVRQQVASVLSVSNGLIAQFSHHHQRYADEQREDQKGERQLPSRRREKLQHDNHPRFKSPVPIDWPLFDIMHIAARRSSFPLKLPIVRARVRGRFTLPFVRIRPVQVQKLQLQCQFSRGLSSHMNSP